MRTLKNHLILYDAECPMCQLYTKAFTRTGMLDPTGRTPYQIALGPKSQTHILPDQALQCPLIDRQRAVNEIALIDTTSGEVSYGIESMFKVIGHSFPLFRPLFNNYAFTWIMRKAYAFISYNRKVIIPSEPQPSSSPSIPQPSFNLNYRLAYLFFTVIAAAAILTRYAHLLTGALPAGGPWREYLICSGQLVYQGMVVTIIAPAKRWEYLGNMTTISLAGALALLPAMGLATLTHLPPLAFASWFLTVAGLMLLEHIRRTRLLSLDWTLTISWIAYRLFVLLLVLQPH
jgi:hypothetical protein